MSANEKADLQISSLNYRLVPIAVILTPLHAFVLWLASITLIECCSYTLAVNSWLTLI
jgi:hypothetical protein